MKRILIPVVAALALTGCKKVDWDYTNVNITIFVRDAQGVNLCSPNMFGHVLWHPSGDRPEKFPAIEYGGQTMTLEPTGLPGDGRVKTRADGPPTWLGFRWNGRSDDGSAALLLGEFSADTKQYRDEPFTIVWADGSQSSEIVFDYYTTDNGREEIPTVHGSIRVTGGTGAGATGMFSTATRSLILTIVK
jgi:hypothetical protein